MNIDAKKAAFREWLQVYPWTTTEDIEAIASKAVEIFGTYTQNVTRPMQENMPSLTKKVFDYMSHGQWVTDYDIACLIGKSEATAGARRRDLRKYGYTVKSQSKGNTWYHLLIKNV